MSGPAVFAYGSLVSRASVAETLGRDPGPLLPARLAGWRRRWSVKRDNRTSEKGFAALDGRSFDHCLGLNLERDPAVPEAAWPNGALIDVSAAELERLDRRELRYRRADVTGAVRAAEETGFSAVIAFVAKDEHLAAAPPARAVVIASYLRACEAAFAELGPGQAEVFAASTDPPPVPVVEARLVRDSIPAGNPRAW